MRSKIQKWGNSLAIRIPKPFAEEVGVDDHADVEITVVDGALEIRPVERPRYALDDLLVEVTDENLHDEVDTGPPAGGEAW